VAGWREIRLWYKDKGHLSILNLFEFKRGRVLDVLELHHVDRFLMLAEGDFLLVRVFVDETILMGIVASFEETLAPLFDRVTVEAWSPTEDARRRILKVRKEHLSSQLPEGDTGFAIRKGTDNTWAVDVADLDSMVDAFATFMTAVAGQFTRIYLREMPARVEDRWLMSVLLHLLLNSVSFDLGHEDEIREFPALG
jgi:hypothetical protein